MAERPRRTFGPALLGGVATSGLTAVAASQTWYVAHGDAAGRPVSAAVPGSDAAPLGVALALVALAAWGVVLVSGTWARRIAMLLGLCATAGVVVVALAVNADDAAKRLLAAQGATSVETLDRHGWYWVVLVAAVGQVVVLVSAFRLVASWPTMSSRYDAPGAEIGDVVATENAAGVDELMLWKALDEGRDPTARPDLPNP